MIPRLRIQGTTICASRWEAEGWLVHVRWLGFVVEFTIARVARTFPDGEVNA